MPNRVFVIGDTHFGHKKMVGPDGRGFESVQEHDDELVYRWNNTVKKHDTVWHLGDVLFGLDSFATLARLKGVKQLVMGNHDHYDASLYLEHFNKLHASVMLRGYLLTHIPVHPQQFWRFKGNIHGHLHTNKIGDNRYINVSAEQVNLTPALLDTVIHNAECRERRINNLHT